MFERRDAVTIEGASYDKQAGLLYCNDCLVRCFFQRAGRCVGVVFSAADAQGGAAGRGTCTYFSAVTSVSPHPRVVGVTTIIAVLAGHVPPAPTLWSQQVKEDSSRPAEVLVSFSGQHSCNYTTGGVVDMTGSLDPEHRSAAVGYYNTLPDDTASRDANPGELADYTVAQLQSETMQYGTLNATAQARVRSAGMFARALEAPDPVHVCSYCNMAKERYCGTGPSPT